ncbi:MAG: DUF1579 domain-containing protein [Thermoanaerobaculia bacterium]
MTVRNRFLVVLAALALVVVLPVWAQEEHPTGQEEHPTGQEEHPEGVQPPAGAMPEMSPEMQAMMEAYMKAGTPGEPHAWLAKSAGSWKTTNTMWMEPGAEPMTSAGKVERKMVLDGRVMVEHFHGDMMGTPFEGMGLGGYNNVTGKYWSIWIDSMSTGTGSGEGTCAEDHSTCTYTLSWADPITGGTTSARIEMEYVGDDSQKFSMYETRDGTEFKSMEIVYERTMASQAAREMKQTASELKEKASEMKQKMQERGEETPE